MPVSAEGEKYHCNICGNEVVVTLAGGGTLTCCDEEMEKIEG
jgi:desulfoferrodoxin-like iron-binding protein